MKLGVVGVSACKGAGRPLSGPDAEFFSLNCKDGGFSAAVFCGRIPLGRETARMYPAVRGGNSSAAPRGSYGTVIRARGND